MICSHCKDTGKYRQPKDDEKFNSLVEWEMDKAYMVNYDMATEKAYKKVGYTIIDCPYCSIASQKRRTSVDNNAPAQEDTL